MKRAIIVFLLILAACESQEVAEERKRFASAADLLGEGKVELTRGHGDRAVELFKRSIARNPNVVQAYVGLAEAYQAVGNESAAVLALKQAEEKSGGDNPTYRHARADIYLRMHDLPNAIIELSELRSRDLLTDKEVRSLAILLGRVGRLKEAFDTIDRILTRAPDDPETKVVEAELLLARRDELLAAKLMDDLLRNDPGLTSARVLRARYFLNNGHPDRAFDDLKMVDPAHAKEVEVVTLQADVFNALGRSAEAVSLLQQMVDENPKSAETLALLAEAKLMAGDGDGPQGLIDQALSLEPRSPRALYVRGRMLENAKRFEDAQLDYQAALKSDPAFVPVLSRLWRVELQLGAKGDAIGTLERLDHMGEISLDEKVSLAELSADTWVNLDRAMVLIDEALKREPKNAKYKAIKDKLVKATERAKPKPKPQGIIIIRGGRH